MVRRVVAAVCAALVVAGCSAGEAAPAAPAPVETAEQVAARLALPESATKPMGLVPAGGAEAGVRPLVSCLELPSAKQAAAGSTWQWNWTAPDGRTAAYRLYSAVYEGITAREVIKQARTVSSCYPAVPDPLGMDRQRYSQGSLPVTKPFDVERYVHCVRPPVDYSLSWEQYMALMQETTCTVMLGRDNRVMSLSITYTSNYDSYRLEPKVPSTSDFAQPMSDVIVS